MESTLGVFATDADPPFKPLLEEVFLGVLFLVLLLVLRGLVDLPQGCHQPGTGPPLSLIAVWVTEMLVGANKVRKIGKLHHHLK